MTNRVLRSLTKTALASTVHHTGLDRLWRALGPVGRTPLILAYHDVVEDFATSAVSTLPPMLISTRTLERQLDWLGRRYRFVGLDEAAALAAGDGAEAAKPTVAITFDDGYRGVYERAFPLLMRKGIPAGVFVVSQVVETGEAFIHDRLFDLLRRASRRWRQPEVQLGAALHRAGVERDECRRLATLAQDPAQATPACLEGLPGSCLRRLIGTLEDDFGHVADHRLAPLNREMLVEMNRAGITIGSHSRNHVWMSNEDRPTLRREARGSREELERGLELEIEHFSYPGGSFDAEAVRAVEQADYRFAYTTCSHRDPQHPLLTIPRRVFWERTCLDAFGRFSPAIMGCRTSGVFDHFSCRHSPSNGRVA